MRILFIACAALCVSACTNAADQAAQVRQAQDQKLTLGQVQREIRVGMSGAEVTQVLGAPNMVTTDEKRQETWVWDKVSTDSAYSSNSGGIGILFLGGVHGSSGASSVSQRTLTVIVKFDQDQRVRDFAYRSSSF